MKDFIKASNNFTHVYFHVLFMIPLQSYQILIHEGVFFQLYDGEFVLMKIISFTFFFTFLNKTAFKDKTNITILVKVC